MKQAQEKGYTEPDPRDDLRGTDFMRKMLIFARDAGYEPEAAVVEIESMLPESCLSAETVDDFYKTLQAENSFVENMKKQAENGKKIPITRLSGAVS